MQNILKPTFNYVEIEAMRNEKGIVFNSIKKKPATTVFLVDTDNIISSIFVAEWIYVNSGAAPMETETLERMES